MNAASLSPVVRRSPGPTAAIVMPGGVELAKTSVKVQTACRDCVMCTGHAFSGAGRSIGRGAVDVATLGITNLARRTCKACGHPMSEHRGDLLNLPPEHASGAPSNPLPQWMPLPDGRFVWFNGTTYTDHIVRNPNDPVEVEATGRALAMNPPRWIQQPDGRFRWWAGLQWTDDFTRDPRGDIEYLPQPQPHTQSAPPPGASAELERLAAMHSAGLLTTEEFAAAKAHVLRL